MGKTSIAIAAILLAGTTWSAAQPIPRPIAARGRRRDRKRIPDGAGRLAFALCAGRDHEAMLAVRERAAEGGRRGDPAAREGENRLSGRRQIHRRLEEGREDRAIRLWLPVHRLSAEAGEGRQLLRLPSTDQGRGELRHGRAEPCSATARSASSAPPRPRPCTRKSTMRRRRIRAPTCHGSATNKILTIDQIKDLVALVMSPDSPVNK